jgi:hypothetical protein
LITAPSGAWLVSSQAKPDFASASANFAYRRRENASPVAWIIEIELNSPAPLRMVNQTRSSREEHMSRYLILSLLGAILLVLPASAFADGGHGTGAS